MFKRDSKDSKDSKADKPEAPKDSSIASRTEGYEPFSTDTHIDAGKFAADIFAVFSKYNLIAPDSFVQQVNAVAHNAAQGHYGKPKLDEGKEKGPETEVSEHSAGEAPTLKKQGITEPKRP